MKKFAYSKEEWAWVMQDWANSAYSLVVTTAIFPLFYKAVASEAGVADADSTAYLGYANSVATIIVGIMAPILGAMADFKGRRKPMFTVSTFLGALSVLAMAFVGIGESDSSWQLLLFLYVLSAIGASSANIFYDASLLDVTSHDRMSNVSAMGFGMGYIGSTLPFILIIGLLLRGNTNQVVRFSFILTTVWWLIFTIPYWRHVHQKSGIEPSGSVIKTSLASIKQTLSQIPQHKNIFRFLLAYFLYIDGVGTIIKMATSIGADIGISGNTMIIVLLLVQLVAFPFTILYGQLAKAFGDKRMIFVGIITYIVICIFAYFMKSTTDFFILAFLVGTAQGGIQSLSRSLFGKLVPDDKSNEYFGIYNVFGKFSSLIGTSLLGIISQLTANSLNGVFGLISLFTIGGLLLIGVEEKN